MTVGDEVCISNGVLRISHIAREAMGAIKRLIRIKFQEEWLVVIDVVCLAHGERQQF